jgi:hypothetical protein
VASLRSNRILEQSLWGRTEFLRQRRNRRNRFIEIQLAICGELLRALRYARNPYKRAVGQCLELAADNRLVPSSSPPSLRWRLIMTWLEVRVLSAPPRSPMHRWACFGRLPTMPALPPKADIASAMCQKATCLIGELRSCTPTRLRAELFHTAGSLFDEGGNGTGIEGRLPRLSATSAIVAQVLW